MLKANHVSKSYFQTCHSLKQSKKERLVLNDVSMEVKEGEFVAVLGRSGSGKTTLLNVLSGLDMAEGEVFLDGEDIFKMKEEKRTMLRRKKIGFIFQSYELLPVLSVMDNIRLPQLKKDMDYVMELLSVLGLKGFETYYPDQLSGGQPQRAAIARALINRPSILLADEPTGNLDSKTERIVIELLKDLVRKYNTSILFVTHNESLVKDVDRVIRLEDGEIVYG